MGSKRTAARAAAKVRQSQVIELRLAGASYRAIAEQLGYANAAGPYKAWKTALKGLITEPAEELRLLELARCDEMQLSLATKVRAGDTDAIRTSLKVMERRAKLTGMDKPVKVDIRAQLFEQAEEFGFTEEEVVQAAEELLAAER